MIESRRIRDAVVAKTGKKPKIYTFTWMDYYEVYPGGLPGRPLPGTTTFLDQVCFAPG